MRRDATCESGRFPRTLAACSAFAPEDERSEIANESLRLTAQSEAAAYPERRDKALAMLVPSLAPADLPRAVELARSTVPDHRYAALAKLAGLLALDFLVSRAGLAPAGLITRPGQG